MKPTVFLASAVALFLGACASTPEPTFGDQIRASEFGAIADDWDRANDAKQTAQKKLGDANRKIQRGENMIEEARRNLRRGETMVEEGTREARRQEDALAAANRRLRDVEERFEDARGADRGV